VVDATVLAAAGLNRLGLRPSGAVLLDAEVFLPAIGQGALAVQVRTEATAALVAPLEDPPTRARTDAERAFLACVGGSCVTPLAAHATLRRDTLTLDALIAAPDGSRLVRGSESAPLPDAEGLGRHLAERLLAAGGADILVALGVR
jgi:hydroxymethylbilane synthase